MQTRKTRHQFYLPDHLSARLDALAAQPGGSKTAVLSEALTAWFEQREAADIDAQFGKALDRQVRAVERIERRLDYLTEVVALLVRFHLTQTAHHPAFDKETQRLGQIRYESFVRIAGQMAARKPRGSAAKSSHSEEESKR
ncbi:CopG family transcriptional regulator [Novosphingobium gossypii]|uniref:CopG family transcriptional regulator n=1 Tax=Novosphingobium gossypii TaxID=1604774 RepID=UPI003D1D5F52